MIASLPAGPYGPAGLYALNVETREPRLLAEGQMAFVSASPNAKRLVGVRYEVDASGTSKEALSEVLPEDGKIRPAASFGPSDAHGSRSVPWLLSVAWQRRMVGGAGPVSGGKPAYALTLYNLDTGATRRLTKSPVWEAAPAVSGDGSLVAFYRYLDGKSSLCVMQADGTKARMVAPCNQ